MGAKINYSALKKAQKQLVKLSSPKAIDQLIEDIAKELAARLLRKVVKRTPVGTYPTSSGKLGGTLKKGWTADTDTQAGSGGRRKAVVTYVNELQIQRSGDTVVIDIINPVNYGIYREYGHRTKDHSGWVQGSFMLTLAVRELEEESPAIIQKRIMNYLGECFN